MNHGTFKSEKLNFTHLFFKFPAHQNHTGLSLPPSIAAYDTLQLFTHSAPGSDCKTTVNGYFSHAKGDRKFRSTQIRPIAAAYGGLDL